MIDNVKVFSEIINNSKPVKQKEYAMFRAYLNSGILRINTEWAKSIGLIYNKYGFDYGLTESKKFVFCKVPFYTFTEETNGLKLNRPVPVIGNDRLLESETSEFKGLLKRPQLISDLAIYFEIADNKNVYSFDFNITKTGLIENVDTIHRELQNVVAKRVNVETYNLSIVNIDTVIKK